MAGEQPATGSGWRLSGRSLKILAVVFTAAAVGSMVLVAVDLTVGRPASGDVFIAFLNSLTAVTLWRLSSK
ncbi:hypothetical protein QFZ36_004230 [Pseudarthrobacter siccitolerans]|uniref:Uncharacterized protein n=1 Tax=Pseudarthrobacter siccitolerans TaxID=861266 RepID=A0ABU0PRJ9_9MICC|nr:hypothetical protein [Pseudarthrobacter siccitolerans]MDQ0676604.1 hypothetical protein [Pseudarthrobacter siccitolerans]